MNELDRKIERILEDMVAVSRYNLHIAEETLDKFRAHHHSHHRHTLASVQIGFLTFQKFTKGDTMADVTPGPVTLTSVGQRAIARLFYFDTDGNQMPSDFKAPAASFSTDDTAGAVAKIVDNGDGTATVTDVADGTATLSVKLAGAAADGSDISASEFITVSNTVVEPPPAPVLGSVKIGFELQ